MQHCCIYCQMLFFVFFIIFTRVIINGVSRSLPPTRRIPQGVFWPSRLSTTANSCSLGLMIFSLFLLCLLLLLLRFLHQVTPTKKGIPDKREFVVTSKILNWIFRYKNFARLLYTYMYCNNYTVRDIGMTIYSTVFKYLCRPRFGYLNRWFVKLVGWWYGSLMLLFVLLLLLNYCKSCNLYGFGKKKNVLIVLKAAQVLNLKTPNRINKQFFRVFSPIFFLVSAAFLQLCLILFIQHQLLRFAAMATLS